MQIHFQSLLLKQPRRQFSVISNLRNPLQEEVGSKTVKYDDYIERYQPSIRAYLTKRRIKKSEVWPKMRIIPNELPQLQHELNLQRLHPIKQPIDLELMVNMFQENILRSSYVISRFTEQHFKPLLDQYVAKVVICGSTVPQDKHEAYWNQREKIVQMYRVFFFGEPLSQLEREIELQYLVEKQAKYLRSMEHPDNAIHRCKWTSSNQRCVELYKNWQSRPISEFGDFRPIFEPLEIESKYPWLQLINKINKATLWTRLSFKFVASKFYSKDSKDYLEWIVEYNFLRMMHWCNSMEFQRLMRIPPDFQIELAVIHFHGWLLINRLKQENTTPAAHMIKRMKFVLNNLTLERIGKLSIKKKNDFQKNVTEAMKLNVILLDYHFNKSPLSKDNPYVKIDGLVWSTVFLEKVERYGEEVYLFGEYAVKTYQMLKEMPIEQLNNCIVDFDAYVADYNYKQKIQAINPPLSKQEFEAELQSDKKNKKYYYSYGLPEVVMPFLNPQADVKPLEIRKNNFMYRLMRVLRKYNTINSFDYFNEVEKLKKEQSKQKQTGWKTDERAVSEINSQFEHLQKIKRKLNK